MRTLYLRSVPHNCLKRNFSEFKIPGIDNTVLSLSDKSESHFSYGSSFLPVRIVIAIGVSFVDFSTIIVPILRIKSIVLLLSMLD